MATLLATFLLAPAVAFAQPVAGDPVPVVAAPVPVESAAEAIAADAARYAAAYGVAPTEAFRRLEAQEASVPLTDHLVAQVADRLAGVTIEHRPDYRIILNTTDPAGTETVIATAPFDVPVVTRGGALTTRAAVLAAVAAHGAEIRAALPSLPGLGIDPRTGALLVVTRASDLDGAGDEAATAARLQAIAGVPVEVRTWADVTQDMSVEGGGRVVGGDAEEARRFVCTSGFVVTDGTQTALATAAHCPDTLGFVDRDGSVTPLPMLGAWGAATQDVQIHAAPAPLLPRFRADSPDLAREVATWRAHASTRAGDFVCHRGERTGYHCAEVAFAEFAPPGELCAGACPLTWVAVRGPDCRGGDSGGPVFLGEVAFGLVKGSSTDAGTTTLYYYMSVDYLPAGWTVAHR